MRVAQTPAVKKNGVANGRLVIVNTDNYCRFFVSFGWVGGAISASDRIRNSNFEFVQRVPGVPIESRELFSLALPWAIP